jgi:precorrin-3B synthase
VPITRTRRDRCPGARRPWPAEDGLLVRLRLVGGRLPVSALRALLEVAEEHGDGRVHVTGRANLQLRGLPGWDNALPPPVLDAIEATGLLPSRSHELVRNIMMSPATGVAGGRADLRSVATTLDRALCAEPALARLPGRFLFVLDDGRGDLRHRGCDLGLVALDASAVQLRLGDAWGRVAPLDLAVPAMIELALGFLARRGDGPTAPWHVHELAEPLDEPRDPDARLPAPSGPLAFGSVAGGRHVEIHETGLDRRTADALLSGVGDEVVVTPWRGIFVPDRRNP